MKELEHDLENAALLLIDLQPDFFSGGALEVPESNSILPGIKLLMQENSFRVKVATQDWHPSDHISFARNHKNRETFETVQCHGHEQVLWPAHCVQGTQGAKLHPELPWEEVDAILRKGRSPDADSYSGFRNNYNAEGIRPPTGLTGYLREREVQSLFLCGLARDVCVFWTALDGAKAGFECFFLWELTRAVNPQEDEQTRKSLREHGVKIIQ